MHANINAAVKHCPLLSLDVHEDGLHRISRSGIDKGSLWIRIKVTGYSICITGEVKVLMSNFIRTHFGSESSVIQGKIYWHNISNIGDVSKIIHRFGEP
ncbi:hypothetical protein B1R32_101151 [Abditibacterium utsteinense]|uniref:Uncharacterized protein n=1 Tax=Abditibacterium utsteinense TaxID=1960156 RepID=A0A2S8SX78_9BACT|nr:hypothetical protein [Abditibacterium utsteinense]PQV65410.1 hypothetical protein B1R32_101151 [Abditibacterium utsteinense]